MINVTMFKAADGTMFDDPINCSNYEKNVKRANDFLDELMGTVRPVDGFVQHPKGTHERLSSATSIASGVMQQILNARRACLDISDREFPSAAGSDYGRYARCEVVRA